MRIKKALITAAGYGTRFFPITKTIQKEMLPILTRPIIDYIVQDVIDAGIEEIVFVVRNTNSQIEQYYSENKAILEYLRKMNKEEKYEQLKNIHTKANFKFVVQTPDQPYGTASPLKISKEYFQDEEAFLVMMGDDYIFNNGNSMSKDMVELFEKSMADALITCIEVDQSLVSKYGIAKYEENDGVKVMTSLVEKPKFEEVNSNLANISKYIFTPKVFEVLENQKINEQHGELLITDTVSMLNKLGSKTVINIPTGTYIDTGYPEGWLIANNLVAQSI